jgi:hypothetical protein
LDFDAYAFVRYLNNPERGALRVFNDGRGALVYANLAFAPLQSLEFGWSAVAVLSAADLDAVTEEEAYQAALLLARVKAEVTRVWCAGAAGGGGVPAAALCCRPAFLPVQYAALLAKRREFEGNARHHHAPPASADAFDYDADADADAASPERPATDSPERLWDDPDSPPSSSPSPSQSLCLRSLRAVAESGGAAQLEEPGHDELLCELNSRSGQRKRNSTPERARECPSLRAQRLAGRACVTWCTS